MLGFLALPWSLEPILEPVADVHGTGPNDPEALGTERLLRHRETWRDHRVAWGCLGNLDYVAMKESLYSHMFLGFASKPYLGSGSLSVLTSLVLLQMDRPGGVSRMKSSSFRCPSRNSRRTRAMGKFRKRTRIIN